MHPSDLQTNHVPADETGKTEAWVVLEAALDSRVYAGLRPGSTPATLRRALGTHTVGEQLAAFTPKPGDAVLLPAGTVHSLGGHVVVFEVQQNSDVTFRLDDWDRVDPVTGAPRTLQVDEALACADFAHGALRPVVPVVETAMPVRRERLVECDHFSLWRISGVLPFTVGVQGAPRVVVCIEGAGSIEQGGTTHAIARGDTVLLPAVLGPCVLRPSGKATVLEIALPPTSQPPASTRQRRRVEGTR